MGRALGRSSVNSQGLRIPTPYKVKQRPLVFLLRPLVFPLLERKVLKYCTLDLTKSTTWQIMPDLSLQEFDL